MIKINELRIVQSPRGAIMNINVAIDDNVWTTNCYLDKIVITDLVREYEQQQHHHHHHHHFDYNHPRNPEINVYEGDDEDDNEYSFPMPLPHPHNNNQENEEEEENPINILPSGEIIIDIDGTYPDSKGYRGCVEVNPRGLYKVEIFFKGLPDPEIGCQGDVNPTTVIVYDRLFLYKVGLYNIKDVLYDCCADNTHSIHFILMWKYFEMCIRSGQLVEAVQLWLRIINPKNKAITNKGCNCGNS